MIEVLFIVEQRSTLLVVTSKEIGLFIGQRPIPKKGCKAEDWALPNNTSAVYVLSTNRVERCSTIHMLLMTIYQ